jgi:hypothetical protein
LSVTTIDVVVTVPTPDPTATQLVVDEHAKPSGESKPTGCVLHEAPPSVVTLTTPVP